MAPVYPDLARERNVDGVVEVAALVCEHGRVVDVRVQKTDNELLDQAALDAVAQWVFKPDSAACWVNNPVKFRLH
jgi:TonB family protein